MYAKIKHALSLTLAVVMAVTMFACCTFSVSAEDTTADAFVPYEGYTWSPLRGFSATESGTVKKTTTEPSVQITEDMPLGNMVETKFIETTENADGTLTGSAVRKRVTYTDNGDGTASVSTEKTTFKSSVFTKLNPTVGNTAFKFGIYSDRECCNAVLYAEDFKPYSLHPTAVGSASVPESNTRHTFEANADSVCKNFASNEPVDNVYAAHLKNSFYATQSQFSDMQNTLMFIFRGYNEMYLEFTAPEDGIYTVSGDIYHTRYSGAAASEENLSYYFVKIDENGIRHRINDKNNISVGSDNAEALDNIKVKLKAGEQLVLISDHLETIKDENYIGNIYLKDYLVTKWDYAEAEDKSTVTTSYNYKNHNFMSVYGENYDIANDNNFETLWIAEAARFSLDRTQVFDTVPFNTLFKDDNRAIAYVSNTPTFFNEITDVTHGTTINYKSDGTIWARADVCPLDEKNVDENGEETTVTNNYRYGHRLTFTVPEDGDVQLIGGLDNGSGNFRERVGIIKAGTSEIEYLKYHSYSGNKVEWVTCLSSSANKIYYREYNLGDLAAGDKIVYELTHNYGSWSNNFERVRLDHLTVNITTSNSAADFNGDFKADATDASYLRKVLLRKVEPVDLLMFNITEDKVVDIRDLVRIKKLLVGEVVA